MCFVCGRLVKDLERKLPPASPQGAQPTEVRPLRVVVVRVWLAAKDLIVVSGLLLAFQGVHCWFSDQAAATVHGDALVFQISMMPKATEAWLGGMRGRPTYDPPARKL